MGIPQLSAWPTFFNKPAGQITGAVHRTAHHDIVINQFVKQDVLLERSQDEEKSPFTQTGMTQPAHWAQLRVLTE